MGFKRWLEQFKHQFSNSKNINYFSNALNRHYQEKHVEHNKHKYDKNIKFNTNYNKFKHCLICAFSWQNQLTVFRPKTGKLPYPIYPNLYPKVTNPKPKELKPINPGAYTSPPNTPNSRNPPQPPSQGSPGIPQPLYSQTVVSKCVRGNLNPQKPTAHTRTEASKILRFQKFKTQRSALRNLYRESKNILKDPKLCINWGRGNGLLGEGSLVHQNSNLHDTEQPCLKQRSSKHHLIKQFMNKLQPQTEGKLNPQENFYKPDLNNSRRGNDATHQTFAKNRHLSKINIGTINIRGFKDVDKQEHVMKWMIEKKLDILAMQETYCNTNSKMKRQNFTYFFSTNITDLNRTEAEKQRKEQKGKGKGLNKIGNQIDQERHGVAFIVRNNILPLIEDVNQIDGRNIALTLKDHHSKILIINTYVPHSGYDSETKNKHYLTLQKVLDQQNAHTKKIILGDFNTRLNIQRDEESDYIGKNIYRSSFNFPEHQKTQTQENREIFLQFCADNQLIATNTFGNQPQKEIWTYTDPVGEKAQLDYILINKKWQNSLLNCKVDVNAGIYSDHRPILAQIRTRLAKPRIYNPPPRYNKPNEEQQLEYNKYVADNLTEESKLDFDEMNKILKEAAEKYFTKVNPLIKKSYISQQTWELIQKRQRIHEGKEEGNLKQCIKQVKKAVIADRSKYVIDKLQDTTKQKPNWKPIKELRINYTPNFTKINDQNGKRVPLPQRAKAVAEYLEQKHWKSKEVPPNYNNEFIHNQTLQFKLGDYTLSELDAVLRNTSDNKSPGPDNMQSEIYKALDSANKIILLNLFNKWHNDRRIESQLAQATVVSIFKKGDTASLENYRPISLLNTLYKIYSAMIKIRLEKALEHLITSTQFGFRKSKSCAHALHIVRRIIDYAEMCSENVITIFLDWEKAFDKVDHKRLVEALRRLKIPEHYLDIIQNLYENPCFQAKYDNDKSEFKKQEAGIRQGCTLSPYLFILLMTVLMHDVKTQAKPKIKNTKIPGLKENAVLFADDTTLVATSTIAAKALLHEVEFQSEFYGLALNKSKCIYFAINKNNNIHFLDGEEMQSSDNVTYLGAKLTKNASIKEEITTRLNKANLVWHKLKTFWKKTSCTISWKLQVYNSVIKSTLLYGLETIHITKAQIDRLNAFHLKGLRYILDLTHTFIDRANTNELIWKTANEKIKAENPNATNIETIEQTLNKRRIKFIGHILRSSNEDPIRAITFEPSSAKPVLPIKRRVGGPKKHWTWETLDLVWKFIEHDHPQPPFNKANTQLDHILVEARNRKF